jgi:hypothetical protein
MVMIAERSTVDVEIEPMPHVGGLDVTLSFEGVSVSFQMTRSGAERLISMLKKALSVDEVDPQAEASSD